MSYPNVDSTPAPSPTQPEIDAVSRERAIDALHRALARLAGDIGRDWARCGKAACLRSRRCRGMICEDRACEPETGGDERAR
jgi:hypothetical protein